MTARTPPIKSSALTVRWTLVASSRSERFFLVRWVDIDYNGIFSGVMDSLTNASDKKIVVIFGFHIVLNKAVYLIKYFIFQFLLYLALAALNLKLGFCRRLI